jgi:hypothetical protein
VASPIGTVPRAATALTLALLFALLGGCSPKQLYDSAAGWREAECNKLLDTPRRERCMKEAQQPYEEYKKQQ